MQKDRIAQCKDESVLMSELLYVLHSLYLLLFPLLRYTIPDFPNVHSDKKKRMENEFLQRRCNLIIFSFAFLNASFCMV